MRAHGCQAVMFHSFGPNLAVRSLRSANLPGARAAKLARYTECSVSTVTDSLAERWGSEVTWCTWQPLIIHPLWTHLAQHTTSIYVQSLHCVCLLDVPAHAALPGAGAARGGRRGLVGPAVIRTLQVPDHLRAATHDRAVTTTVATTQEGNTVSDRLW